MTTILLEGLPCRWNLVLDWLDNGAIIAQGLFEMEIENGDDDLALANMVQEGTFHLHLRKNDPPVDAVAVV